MEKCANPSACSWINFAELKLAITLGRILFTWYRRIWPNFDSRVWPRFACAPESMVGGVPTNRLNRGFDGIETSDE